MPNILIFSCSFMGEHGKKDRIAPPRWVEHEYDKVRRYYLLEEKILIIFI